MEGQMVCLQAGQLVPCFDIYVAGRVCKNHRGAVRTLLPCLLKVLRFLWVKLEYTDMSYRNAGAGSGGKEAKAKAISQHTFKN